MPKIRALLFLLLLALALPALGPRAALPPEAARKPGSGAAGDSLLDFLGRELRRNFAELGKADSLPPYFLAYRLNDTSSFSFAASMGGVVDDREEMRRYLDAEVRVGDHRFDNTRPLRENMQFDPGQGRRNIPLPPHFDSLAYSRAARLLADFGYRSARDDFFKIRANAEVRPKENDSAFDFAPWPAALPRPSLAAEPADSAALRLPLDSLRAHLSTVSRFFANRPLVYAATVSCDFSRVRKRFVSSEGVSARQEEFLGNVSLYAETKAEDGMILWLGRNFFFRHPPGSFPRDSLERAARLLADRLDSLRSAPVLETYMGPVLLQNVAAAVFLHEVFGHRVEGHRQKAADEGQTFIAKAGQSLTLPQVEVFDDPLLEHFGPVPLNGFYRFDDEGVPARKALLIQKGRFRGFLWSRSTLGESTFSNGHGRGILGLPVTARMANTVLRVPRGESVAVLRSRLRERLRREGKPYGLVVYDISGGFTHTGRDLPQSFRVEPLHMAQVFADGRPDRLVRGADLVGTPLVSLRQIVAVGNDPAVFNGYCGAESGWLPVSAVSPSLLFSSLEFESRSKDQNLPPLLPPPLLSPAPVRR